MDFKANLKALLATSLFVGALAAPLQVASAQENDLRLHMLQLQVHIQKGDMAEAKEVVEYIEANHAKTPDAHVARGSYEEKKGNWRKAMAEYQMALSMREGNEDYQQLVENLHIQRDPFVRYDISFRHEDNGEYHILNNVTARAYLNEKVALSTSLTRDDFDVDTLQRTNGNLQNNFSGARHIGHLTVERDQHDKNPMSLGVHLSDDVAGLQGAYTWLNTIEDYTTLTLNYRLPTWDFIETEVDGGHKTGGLLEHTHQFDARWRGNIGAGYHEYGIDGYNSVDKAIDTRAGLRYLAHQTPTLTFDVGYGMFGQYLVEDGTISPLGTPIDPIGITSTELHNIDVTTVWQPNRQWRVENTLGYSFNRLDSSGSFGRLAVTHRFQKKWEAQLRFDTSLSTDGRADRISTVGFYIQRRFN